jgi:Protein of unknown function (DUF3619)
MNEPLQPAHAPRSVEAAQARFALRVTAALSEHQAQVTSADIDARLHFAHDQALAIARQVRLVATAAPAVIGISSGAAVLSTGPAVTPWWLRLGSLLPLAVLLAGLALIDNHYTRSQIEAAAEVDAAILADDLPPEAYRDQGFVEFLKTARP